MRRVIAKTFPSDRRIQSSADIGAFIRAARTQSGMTLEEAALSIGIAKQTMQNVEKAPEKVSFGVLLTVAKGMGISLLACPTSEQDRILRTLDVCLTDSSNA